VSGVVNFQFTVGQIPNLEDDTKLNINNPVEDL
jgi:hypothetical protein